MKKAPLIEDGNRTLSDKEIIFTKIDQIQYQISNMNAQT